jgi:hypothetical protein
MKMNKMEKVEPYKVKISKEVIKRWNGVVRVWSEPMSAVEGSQVLDEISEPIEVTVTQEQKDIYGSLSQRAYVEYGGDKQGWVLFDAIEVG